MKNSKDGSMTEPSLFFYAGCSAHYFAAAARILPPALVRLQFSAVEIPLESYPMRRRLPALYRAMLKLSRRRGARTLSRLHSRIFPGAQRITHWSGSEMIVPGDPHFFGYLVDHEAHIAAVIRDLVREGDTCVDVGANIGYFSTMLAGACGSTGRVICYEPESRNFSVLESNSKLAERKNLRLLPVRAAVSEHEGVVHLQLAAHSTEHRISDAAIPAAASESVPAVNLAEDLRRRGITGFVRFLKMDVEGHEIPALRGASEWLASRSVGTMVVEVEAGEHARAVEKMISDWKARAVFWYGGAWQQKPVGEIPCRLDVRVDFV
jgi:FkbM family methyltransferase